MEQQRPDAGMLRVGAKIAHYVVTRLLGRGGMGEVYLARDTHLGRKVALKIIKPNQLGDDDSINRFLMEARMTARFNHPHIITIYGVGIQDGLPYVALEYLEGQNLWERCREEQPTLQESLRICLAVGEAVTEAHRHGVLHRDLKPANILIPKDGRLRVADFGLAQETGMGTVSGDGVGVLETQDGSDQGQRMIGTPAYMAPEQWSRQVCTPATDVWALGTILHELIVGTRPYGDMSSLKLGLHVCSDEPTPISSDLNAVPSEIHDLVRSCLQRVQRRVPRQLTLPKLSVKSCRPVDDPYPCRKARFAG